MEHVPVKLLVPAIAWQYRLYEPELGRMADFVPRGQVAVDVGVWWGPWSWWLARRASSVHSFEANPDLAARVAPALPHNVTVHPVALSDRGGVSTLSVPARGTGAEGRSSIEPGDRPGAWTERTVETRRLDDFSIDGVGFLKIDVEGHELAVLEGARELIGAQRPTVMVEIEEAGARDSRLDKVVDFFSTFSYGGEYLHGGRWHPIAELDRAATAAMGRKVAQHGYVANLALYARHYVHNFVFRPG